MLLPPADTRYPSVKKIPPPPAAPDVVHGLLFAVPVVFVPVPAGVLHGVPHALHLPLGLGSLLSKVVACVPEIFPPLLLLVEDVPADACAILMRG